MGAGELVWRSTKRRDRLPETDEASKMLKWLIPVMGVLLLLVLAFMLESYMHPMPEQDCSKSYDYPICVRAEDPSLHEAPSTIALFLGIVFAVVLAIVLCYAGYHASVVEQTAIITPTANIGKPAEPSKSVEQKPVEKSKPVEQKSSYADMILPPLDFPVTPPTKKPTVGIDKTMVK
jgi:hypothetical protein